LVDARTGLTEQDERIVRRLPANLRRVVVHNKVDLTKQAVRIERHASCDEVYLSAKQGEGIHLLQELMLQLSGWEPAGEDIYIARERHLFALEAAAACLAAAAQMQASELFAEELRRAQGFLSEITGQFSADDLLGEIFSRFCIGK
jgi:tRNA modification GTPase